MTEEGKVKGTPLLTEDQVQQLVTRLYEKALDQKNEKMQQLNDRFYPTVSQKRLPREAIDASVTRQVDQEMAKRRGWREEQQRCAERQLVSTKISSSELADSVGRLYTDSVAKKKANMQASRERYLFTAPEPVKKSQKEIREYVAQLSVPKKREFTVDEINKIYDLV
ncbi:hypothetical protein ERJ75_000709800 [Trypanosoma vivax]|uniref:Uncharacterized protein n=1 Tax=Trypanosoma vivax (strain Y486) TaxID=1055687 RepID=G0TTX8_TRYVY|nr:hypothetical protein ERJ75_000709800 [Trypanosoma vivax]CCC47411.1 conserved hypothetical protein [Trypanosoma vivax Y486]